MRAIAGRNGPAPQDATPWIAISEVCPATLAKADGIYRFQIVLRAASSPRIAALAKAALAASPVEAPFRAAVDIDAHSF